MRVSKSARAIASSRDKTIADLKADSKKDKAALRKARRGIEERDKKIKRQDDRIRKLTADKRQLAADNKAKDAEAKKANRRSDRLEAALEKSREEGAEKDKEICRLERKVYQYEGPHVPGSKTRQKRNEDRRKKREAGEEEGKKGEGGAKGGEGGAKGGEGGKPRRRSGGQPGRRAARREFVPDRRVVIEKPDSCGTGGCISCILVDKYTKRTVHDRPPPRKPSTVEAQCPRWKCTKCKDSGTATAGTAVPLHLFRAEAGDAEPERPAAAAAAAAGQGDAEAVSETASAVSAAAGAGGGPCAAIDGEKGGASRRQPAQQPQEKDEGEREKDEVVEAMLKAMGGGDMDVDRPINDFSGDPDESIQICLPRRGVIGPNIRVAAIKDYFNRLSVRMSRESQRDDGVKISEGMTNNIAISTGKSLQPAFYALIAMLASALVIHADKTRYNIEGELWNLWVFFDPLRKIPVYWLSPDGDNAVLERILVAWNGIIVCDGAPVFQKYTIQRCWAHILNEAKYYLGQFPDSESVRHVSDRLHKIFHDAKEFKGTREERMNKRYEFTRRIRKIVDDYCDDPDLAAFMTKLDNAAYDLFKFVVEPWVPPTNNPAEKLLREPVVLRKIRGALRSAAGAAAFCALMSCRAAWNMHGLRPLAEIRRAL